MQQTIDSTATVVQPAPAGQQTTALATKRSEQISGTYHEAEVVDAKLAFASKRAHLITPFTAAGALPAGFAVALAAVKVDPETETYPIPGGDKLGLAKVALDKIGMGLGISWDPMRSGRVDDGKEPRYCRWRAVGSYMGLDGIRHVVIGEKEMDLRDGSPQVEALEARQRAKGKDATREVRELRMHIQSHAETKARLRAIRSMGIRTSYGKDELAKPFVAAKVVFTGQTDDPALRAEFSKMLAQNALTSTHLLFGPPPVVEPVRQPAPEIVDAPGPDEDDETPPPPPASIEAAAQQAAKTAPAQPAAPAASKVAKAADPDDDLEIL